jgi:SAM-dependent methyltransferase
VHDETGAAAPETEAEAEERLRHGASFGAAAGAYAEHRPSYAQDAVRWALEPVQTRRPLRVADLGAGTGKLTATVTGLGADVTAIEPDPQMLAELRRQMPGVRSAAGTAEDIPLPDGSVDAVLAAQAMHWFDMDRAIPEIARVLAPGGVLAGLWNVDDDRVDWVAGLADMSKHKASVTLRRWHEGQAHSRQEQLLAAGSGHFEAAETGEFANGQTYTAGTLVANIATHSHLLVMDQAERAGLLARIGTYLRSQPETAGDEFILPMVTVVLRARRR